MRVIITTREDGREKERERERERGEEGEEQSKAKSYIREMCGIVVHYRMHNIRMCYV